MTELAPKIDLNDPRIWSNMFFVPMEAGLMEIVQYIEVTLMTVSSTYIDLFIGAGNVRGEMSGGNCPDAMYHNAWGEAW